MAKIEDKHMYHGAALSQIALHPSFTAINSTEIGGKKSRSAYRINASIGLYLKYAKDPRPPYTEYQFTFSQVHLRELEDLAKGNKKTFVAFVCKKSREIACLSREELLEKIAERKAESGKEEAQYVLLVTATPGNSLRVYTNVPGKKKLKMGELVVKRKDFPNRLFK